MPAKNELTPSGPLLGAHMSTAGGIHTAFERGGCIGCATMQIFVKTNNQWAARPLTDDDISKYKTEQAKTTIAPLLLLRTRRISSTSAQRGTTFSPNRAMPLPMNCNDATRWELLRCFFIQARMLAPVKQKE